MGAILGSLFGGWVPYAAVGIGLTLLATGYHAVKAQGRSEAESYYIVQELKGEQKRTEFLQKQVGVANTLTEEARDRGREREQAFSAAKDRLAQWEQEDRRRAQEKAAALGIEIEDVEEEPCLASCKLPDLGL